MKLYKRFLSVFLCFVSLFVLFSSPVSADEVDTSTYKVNIYAFETFLFKGFGQLDLLDGQTGFKDARKTPASAQHSKLRFQNQLAFVDTTGGAIFKGGKVYSFSASNFLFRYSVNKTDGNVITSDIPTQVFDAYIVYPDNLTEKVDATVTHVQRYNTYTINIPEIKPREDVVRLVVTLGDEISTNGVNLSSPSGYMAWGTIGADQDYNLSIDISVQSEEAGLLSGLLKWVKDIFDTVSYGFASIGTWFAELPGKIWTVFENGIKALFVPESDYIAEYRDLWDSLLSDHLGAVYQVCSIVTDSWESIKVADLQNTVYIPPVSLHFENDTFFTFGDYEVQIIPEGFEVLVEAVKLIIGIVCTYLFINGLLKRYEEVMGVEK